jgi:hypothetical protein
MSLVWATRGRTWGFRFLRDGGLNDPLVLYRKTFAGLEGESKVCQRFGEVLALRFPDPVGRKDRSGRVIPHDFILFAPLSDGIDSVEQGRRVVWPLVRDEYRETWRKSNPLSTQ